MKFAVSILVRKDSVATHKHGVFMVESASKDEATGKGLRISFILTTL